MSKDNSIPVMTSKQNAIIEAEETLAHVLQAQIDLVQAVSHLQASIALIHDTKTK